MKAAFLIGALVLAVGCKKSPEPMEGGMDDAGQPPAGWQTLPPAETPTADETPAEAPVEEDRTLETLPEAIAVLPFNEAVAMLRTSAEEVRVSEATDHAALVNALNALADAVYALPEAEDKEMLRTNIRTYADKIKTSDPGSMEHADWAKSAMKEAAGVVKKVGEARKIEMFDTYATKIDDQVDAIAADKALLEQREAVANALLSMAETLQMLAPERTGAR